jgi:hypothetical protein
MARRRSKQQHLVPTAKQAAKMVKAQGKPRVTRRLKGGVKLPEAALVPRRPEGVFAGRLEQELEAEKAKREAAGSALKDVKTLVNEAVIFGPGPEFSESTLDRAVIFIKAGTPLVEASYVAADAGIPQCVQLGEIPLPADFDDDAIYWDHAYIG